MTTLDFFQFFLKFHREWEGADSRGRTLESFISNVNPFPIGWQSEVHFCPGAPISKISNELFENFLRN